jgi:hypothetical protein
MKCNQQGCQNEAAFRFTWPGSDEAGICAQHAPKLDAVAQAMGLHLQVIPLLGAEKPATQLADTEGRKV